MSYDPRESDAAPTVRAVSAGIPRDEMEREAFGLNEIRAENGRLERFLCEMLATSEWRCTEDDEIGGEGR